MIRRPHLLDVTRLVSRSWTRRRSTGIDRVCLAYLDHFGARAHAVVQHRGVFRVLDADRSDELFDLLRGPQEPFRLRFARFAPVMLAKGRSRFDGREAVYLNVSHTDFDLASHARWIHDCRLRPVYMLHDLIPITHGEFCRPRAVRRHYGRVIGALRNAAGIVVNSEATAQELKCFSREHALPLPPTLAARLAGAHLAAQPGIAPCPAQAPYFVCLGTIERRKNHMLLIDVWEALVARMGAAAPRLVIAGQWGIRSGDVRRRLRDAKGLREHVMVMEALDDGQVGALVAGARAMLLPSRAEGFGLPMVEALRLGTPVIASDLPSFREIGQGIPALLDPLDREGWMKAVSEFCRDDGARARQLDLLPGFRPPTWTSHFAQLEPWLSSLPGKAAEVVAFPPIERAAA